MKNLSPIIDNKDITTKEYVDAADALKENVANKSVSVTSGSTDTQYPSAKAVYTFGMSMRQVPASTVADADKFLRVSPVGEPFWATVPSPVGEVY